jgi:hypothetical protein
MTRWFAVLALCAALPAAAEASTIAYTRGGDVWLVDPATGEGGAVTTDGTPADPYRSPSQADDGTIVAVRGAGAKARLHRFDQAGRRLGAPFETAAPTTGPLAPQVSADGSTVAYHFATVVDGCGPFYTCPDTATGIKYTAADRFTDPGPYGDAGGFQNPSWIDANRTLVFGPGAWIHVLGTDNSRQWIPNDTTGDADAAYRNMTEGEVSRDGRRVAVVLAHYEDGTGFLQLYRPEGDFTNAPRWTCRIKAADGSLTTKFSDPTWSPDATQLAWAEPDGIRVATVGDAPCSISDVVTVDGQEPDWGAAAYAPPPVRPVLAKVRAAGRASGSRRSGASCRRRRARAPTR